MQLAMIGPGRMGASMVRRLIAKGHACAIWLMVPAAFVDKALEQPLPHLDPGDIVRDAGNSYDRDDIRRAKALSDSGHHHVDVGTSGGVAGLDRGYCLMIGGEANFANQVLSAMRHGFGGHIEKKGGA